VREEIGLFEADQRMLARPGKIRLRTREGVGAWIGAEQQLLNATPMAAFEWSDALALAARDHCLDTGPRGMTGHVGSDGSTLSQRIARYGDVGGPAAENIAYEQIDGAAYMRQLYIDDGLPKRGHRVNMLNPALKVTGMHACDHLSLMKGMIVAVYAPAMEPNNNVPTGCDSNKWAATPNPAAGANSPRAKLERQQREMAQRIAAERTKQAELKRKMAERSGQAGTKRPVGLPPTSHGVFGSKIAKDAFDA